MRRGLSEKDYTYCLKIIEKKFLNRKNAVNVKGILQKRYALDLYSCCFARKIKIFVTKLTILSADFSDWSNNICFNANVYTIILIFGCLAGGGLLVYGIIDMRRNRLKRLPNNCGYKRNG